MWILRSIMDRIWKLDGWILDRFQYLANLAYTRWETSPYAIATQCFNGAGMVVSGIWFVALTDGEAWSKSPGVQVAMIFLGVLVLATVAGESHFAHQRHLRWLRDGTGGPPSERYPFTRLMWLFIFMISALPAFILGLLINEVTLRTVLTSMWDIAMVCGFYLLSCTPPSRIEKKQEDKDMVPNPV